LVGDLIFSLEISPAQPPRLALSKARIDVASFSTWQQGLVPKLGNSGGWLNIEWMSTVYIKYKYIHDNKITIMIMIIIFNSNSDDNSNLVIIPTKTIMIMIIITYTYRCI